MKDRVRDVGRGKMWELQEETGVSGGWEEGLRGGDWGRG